MNIFLQNLYDNTMGVYYQKHLLTNQKLKTISDIRLYLDIYIEDLVDLLLSFNSFLLLYNIHTCKLKRSIAFKHKANGNDLYSLLDKALKNNPINGSYCDRMRIYEYLFRHMYAHGNGINLINTLLLKSSNQAPFFMLVKRGYKNQKGNDVDSVRILLEPSQFKKHKQFLLNIYPSVKFYKKKLIDGTLNGIPTKEYFYLLDEPSSRSYIKLSHYKDNFSDPDMLNYRSNRFNTYKIDLTDLLCVGIMKNEKDRIKIPTSYINYDSISDEIDYLIFHIISNH